MLFQAVVGAVVTRSLSRREYQAAARISENNSWRCGSGTRKTPRCSWSPSLALDDTGSARREMSATSCPTHRKIASVRSTHQHRALVFGDAGHDAGVCCREAISV